MLKKKTNKENDEKANKVGDEKIKSWRKSDPKVRADILFRSAAIVRRRKLEFTAHLVKEGGKPWKEADADVAEGIDFLEYYGRQMLEIKTEHMLKVVQLSQTVLTISH